MRDRRIWWARGGVFALAVSLLAANAAAQGFFGRGDNDCSAVLDAADLVGSIQAIGGTNRCDNNDCDRDQQITGRDVGCTAQCLFGSCPLVANGPTILSVTPETTAAITPAAVLRLNGMNFGTAAQFRQVTVDGIGAEIIDATAETLRIIVPPFLAPGRYDVVVIAGDVPGGAHPIDVTQPLPVGAADSLESTFDLLDLAIDKLLGLDLESAFAEAATIRAAVQEFRDSLASQRAALAADPAYTAELRAQLDAIVDASGVPELLRTALAQLDSVGGGGNMRRGGGDIRELIAALGFFGFGLAAAAALLASLPAVPAAALAAIAAALGVLAGQLTTLASAPSIPAVPLLRSMTFTDVEGMPSQYPMPSGSVQVQVDNIDPQNAALYIGRPSKPYLLPPSNLLANGMIGYVLPDGLCGRVDMAVYDVGTRVGTASRRLRVKPDFYGPIPDGDVPIGLRVAVSPLVPRCLDQTRVVFEDPDMHTQFRSRPDAASTAEVPDVPLKTYRIGIEVEGLASSMRELGIIGINRYFYSCGDKSLFVRPEFPASSSCISRVFPSNIPDSGKFGIHWTSSHVSVATVDAADPPRAGDYYTGITAVGPGTTDVTATLVCRGGTHICDKAMATNGPITITVADKTDPTIQASGEPPPGNIMPGSTIMVHVKAHDNVAPVRLRLVVNGEAAMSTGEIFECGIIGVFDEDCETTFEVPLKAGGFMNRSVSIVASAVDGAGNSAVAPALAYDVGPPDHTPPLAMFVAPADGANVAPGATVQVRVHVSDNAMGDSGVRKVIVRAAGDAIATATMPESVCLPVPIADAIHVSLFTVKSGADLAAVSDRRITITAQVFDNANADCDGGNASEVQTVTVSVGGPMITSVPPQVNAGELMTIDGSGFGSAPGNSTVTIGGAVAAIAAWSDTRLVVTVPATLSGPDKPVIVTVDGVASNAVNTTVLGTGDVQVTLEWFDTNDLDLHVTDPSGQEVFYANRGSASGGMLDVDANAGCRSTSGEPKENIFWPVGGAPRGMYQVRVVYFDGCTTPKTASSFTVMLRLDGEQRLLLSGSVGPGNTSASENFTR